MLIFLALLESITCSNDCPGTPSSSLSVNRTEVTFFERLFNGIRNMAISRAYTNQDTVYKTVMVNGVEKRGTVVNVGTRNTAKNSTGTNKSQNPLRSEHLNQEKNNYIHATGKKFTLNNASISKCGSVEVGCSETTVTHTRFFNIR